MTGNTLNTVWHELVAMVTWGPHEISAMAMSLMNGRKNNFVNRVKLVAMVTWQPDKVSAVLMSPEKGRQSLSSKGLHYTQGGVTD